MLKSPFKYAEIIRIQHQRAVKAFEKAGFRVIREGKHISMAKDDRIIIIPRNNPINAFTMGELSRTRD